MKSASQIYSRDHDYPDRESLGHRRSRGRPLRRSSGDRSRYGPWRTADIKSAVFTFRKAGKEQQEYLKITLSDVMVSSVSLQDHSAGSDLADESVSLAYAKVEEEYHPQNPDGTLGAGSPVGWNVKENKQDP